MVILIYVPYCLFLLVTLVHKTMFSALKDPELQ